MKHSIVFWNHNLQVNCFFQYGFPFTADSNIELLLCLLDWLSNITSTNAAFQIDKQNPRHLLIGLTTGIDTAGCTVTVPITGLTRFPTCEITCSLCCGCTLIVKCNIIVLQSNISFCALNLLRIRILLFSYYPHISLQGSNLSRDTYINACRFIYFKDYTVPCIYHV